MTAFQRPVVLVKVGGSLCAPDALESLAPVLGGLLRYWRAVLLPGGGPFADTVRSFHARCGLSEEVSHQMALLAMEQYGWVLHHFVVGSRLIHHPNEAPPLWEEGILPIFQPAAYLEAVPAAELPRTWKATSDTIAGFLAPHFGARALVLLKSTDPVSPDWSRSEEPLGGADRLSGRAMSQGAGMPAWAVAPDGTPLVDPLFPGVLDRYALDAWLLNGRRPADLLELATGGSPRGLRVVGHGREPARGVQPDGST